MLSVLLLANRAGVCYDHSFMGGRATAQLIPDLSHWNTITMAIDPYALCPGGSGKKLKFCCPDLISDLEELNRMMAGEQHLAALKHIEDLQERYPDRAPLLALKSQLLRVLGRPDEARATVDVYLERYPGNPVALAESAILTAAEGDGRAAMAKIQESMAACDNRVYFQVYEAMGAAAGVLLAEGKFRAARALWQLQLNLIEDDHRPLEVLARLNCSQEVPLLIRQDQPLAECPAGAAWKSRFDEAMAPVRKGHWAEAARRLSALAEEMPDSPVVWQNLGVLYGWLADTPGSIEALRRFAALDVPLEDAVEAEATAVLLSEEGLGDQIDVLSLGYPIKDAEHVVAAFSTSKQAVQIPVDRSADREDEVPPKAIFLLLDRAVIDAVIDTVIDTVINSAENVTLQNVPRVLGQMMLYGRQTDREARLEVTDVNEEDLEAVKALVAQSAGDELSGEPNREVLTRVSATAELLRCRWRLPGGITREQLDGLIEQYFSHAILEQWPRRGLGLLGGKSPQDAAGEEVCRIKLLAAIMVMEFANEQSTARFDFNRLRSKLGLPTLGPIDPAETPPERLPLVRLSRVTAEKLSDRALRDLYHLTAMFGVTDALRNFARELVERPGLDDQDELIGALDLLTRIEEDSDRRLAYLDQARRTAESAGRSSAQWDLMELAIRMERGETEEASRLFQHLQSDHVREPGVAEALMRLLVQLGAIRPDGTPIPADERQQPADATADSPQPAELWTPDSQKPADQKPGLWTPGRY